MFPRRMLDRGAGGAIAAGARDGDVGMLELPSFLNVIFRNLDCTRMVERVESHA